MNQQVPTKITKAPTPSDGTPCQCGDQTNKVPGDGFVTGGGWVMLDGMARYRGNPIDPAANRANFGFNAKFNNAGVPRGSTNFVFEGGSSFHFHSTTGGASYGFLEIPNGVQARWGGTGTLAEAGNNAQAGYSFYVAVQDWGEPGADDTWRIRIWETANTSNAIFDSAPQYSFGDTNDDRFMGTALGPITKNGGGNIQLHRKGITPPLVLPSNKKCHCKDTPSEGDGDGFVTGGGWINVAQTAIWNSEGSNSGPLEIPVGARANFGFNAKFQRGLPDGSTNFVFEGGHNFHFHSATGGNAHYDSLEVPSPTEARWCGPGSLATGADPKPRDFQDGYSFCVSVQDLGEPGAEDTWHIKIWKGSIVVFDSNPEFDIMSGPDRFEGTRLGEEEQNGGGNIQIHWKE